jgi:hypothetical protein
LPENFVIISLHNFQTDITASGLGRCRSKHSAIGSVGWPLHQYWSSSSCS